MASIVAKALPLASRRTIPHRLPVIPVPPWHPMLLGPPRAASLLPLFLPPPFLSNIFGKRFRSPFGSFSSTAPLWGFFAIFTRDYRKVRQRGWLKKNKLGLDVKICIEEELPNDPQIMSIAEKLQSDVPVALKVALDGLKISEYSTRDTSINDFNKYEKVELSVLLCDDDFIQKLNKEWRDIDQATDVLSMSQHIPELDLPILSLGDVVISLETAVRQAHERGYTLLDEIRILMVHGLLHLLGFDHEISLEAEVEMEKVEELIIRNLGWTGKGLIKSSHDSGNDESHLANSSDQLAKSAKVEGRSGLYESRLSYVFCDVDGTLFNYKSQINTRMGEALREALSSGAKIAIVTGKTRSAVLRASTMVNLSGKDGIVSEESPGVFLQGSLVYGREGQEIYRAKLDKKLCTEAFLYSSEHKVALVAFCQDQCFTLFQHPLVDLLHTMHYEPKAEIIPSVQHLLAVSDVQKLLFLGTAEEISRLRPYWLEATTGIADVVQAPAEMLEIVPCGVAKNYGVKLLLDHLGIVADEIMPHFEGKNTMEMQQSSDVELDNAGQGSTL
ncbi:hypothetical protein Cni_G28468 [Canna indica]|uniref:Haloacid dehalogenase-like hydrolase family protein n=1 Tax=Canna indica TaxID=4628 RepID=A0AAQ3QSC8_9LILI|nr:hypothetical protein Cni_G28468 [Canna indica]